MSLVIAILVILIGFVTADVFLHTKVQNFGCTGTLISVRTHQNGIYCFVQPFRLTESLNSILPFSGTIKLYFRKNYVLLLLFFCYI